MCRRSSSLGASGVSRTLLALELSDHQALPAHDDAWLAARVGLDRLGSADGTASFTVCAISQADFEALQETQRRHYRAMRALIAASDPGERVVLLNLQTLALDSG